MKPRPQVRLFTLVQHSGFGLAGNPQFQHAVEEVCLTNHREVERVRKAGGVLLDDYLEACHRVEQENYPPWVEGLIPRVAGRFAKAEIGGLKVYVPPYSGWHSANTGPRNDAARRTGNPGSRPSFRHPADTPAGKQERAVAVLLDPHGFVQQKWDFLRQKGMSDNKILEALNTATEGEVIRAAGLEILRVHS